MKRSERIKSIPKLILKFFIGLIKSPFEFAILLLTYLRFLLLLINFIVYRTFKKIFSSKIIPEVVSTKLLKGIKNFDYKIKRILNIKSSNGLIPSKIIDITVNYLIKKRNRTIITIGGVAIGIGAIVFLVSLGFGLQELVIKRIASFEERQQITIYSRNANTFKIDDKIISEYKNYAEVKDVQPLISVVGTVSYNNSISTTPVYGVTKSYLESSALNIIQGKLFESNDLAFNADKLLQETSVKGIQIDSSQSKSKMISFLVLNGKWMSIYDKADTKSSIIGYTKQDPNQTIGEIVKQGNKEYVYAPFYLWQAKKCNTNTRDCYEGKYVLDRNEFGYQKLVYGYIELKNVKIVKEYNSAEVLGTSEERKVNIQDFKGEVKAIEDGFVEIPEETPITAEEKVEKITLSSFAEKKAVVNTAFVKLLDIKEENVIGKEFKVKFKLPSYLLNKPSTYSYESTEDNYEIIGVIDDRSNPYFYVPYSDLRSLSIVNSSQVRLTAHNQEEVASVRRKVETKGLITRSILDTVEQVNSLFSSITVVLGIMGFIALVVASLGMFNTFTISLLERTREIGLMKAMGMRSNEVRDLFMTESIIMGTAGGFTGLFLGYIISTTVNFLVSSYSISKGAGELVVSSVPIPFIIMVTVLSVLVGVLTGIYPAYRSKKISALDALRYE